MQTVEIPVPAGREVSSLPTRVPQVCVAIGLRLTLAGTLKTYPGSQHWHFQRGAERGTLELTWWPAQRRLWIKVAAGRTSAWQRELLPGLQAALAEAVQALPVMLADHSIER